MADKQTVTVFSGNADGFGLLDEKRRVALPVDDLRKNLEDFMEALKTILPAADKPAAGMGLESVSVAVGIDGKGQFGFLGTGVEVGGSATLTLNFARPK